MDTDKGYPETSPEDTEHITLLACPECGSTMISSWLIGDRRYTVACRDCNKWTVTLLFKDED
jgi:transcription elongation factor Elf1